MSRNPLILPTPDISPLIRTIRDMRVILDSDLAKIYGATTKRLNEQFRRNRERFPQDFAFQLTDEEARIVNDLRSQIATSNKRGGRRYRPYAFTEHGALMAANILNSPRAVAMSVYVIRGQRRHPETIDGDRQNSPAP